MSGVRRPAADRGEDSNAPLRSRIEFSGRNETVHQEVDGGNNHTQTERVREARRIASNAIGVTVASRRSTVNRSYSSGSEDETDDNETPTLDGPTLEELMTLYVRRLEFFRREAARRLQLAASQHAELYPGFGGHYYISDSDSDNLAFDERVFVAES